MCYSKTFPYLEEVFIVNRKWRGQKKTDQSWDEVRWKIKFKIKMNELLIATMKARLKKCCV